MRLSPPEENVWELLEQKFVQTPDPLFVAYPALTASSTCG